MAVTIRRIVRNSVLGGRLPKWSMHLFVVGDSWGCFFLLFQRCINSSCLGSEIWFYVNCKWHISNTLSTYIETSLPRVVGLSPKKRWIIVYIASKWYQEACCYNIFWIPRLLRLTPKQISKSPSCIQISDSFGMQVPKENNWRKAQEWRYKLISRCDNDFYFIIGYQTIRREWQRYHRNACRQYVNNITQLQRTKTYNAQK